jgi:hypothetical protein
VTVTVAWLSYDTRLDRRPNDTARRLASGGMTPTLRHQVITVAGAAPPDAQWQDWTRRHAYATVQATLTGDEHPPDTTRSALRQVMATITLHGNDGWTSTVQQVEFLSLTLVDRQWRVASVTSQPT